MSNEPMLSEPTTIEPVPSTPVPSGPAPLTSGRSADAELVLAAIDRMEAASRSDRTTLDRLHAELAATARTIAQAKIAMRSGAVKPDTVAAGVPLDVAALLDELEHRVDAMLEIGGHVRREKDAPAEQQPVEPDRVPTVSGVVSRLGRAGDWSPEEMDSPPSDSGGGASSASMLEAMVLALSALDGASHPEAEARTADEAVRRAAEKAVPEAAAATDESVQLADGAALTPMPAATIMPDNELMTNFARMEAFPIPPPETSAAVVFASCEPEAAADVTPAPETAEAFPADASEPDAQAAPAPPSPTLPEAEQAQPEQPAASAQPAPATPAEPNSSDEPAPSAARPDPLAPLNAMSDAEKIALFS